MTKFVTLTLAMWPGKSGSRKSLRAGPETGTYRTMPLNPQLRPNIRSPLQSRPLLLEHPEQVVFIVDDEGAAAIEGLVPKRCVEAILNEGTLRALPHRASINAIESSSPDDEILSGERALALNRLAPRPAIKRRAQAFPTRLR